MLSTFCGIRVRAFNRDRSCSNNCGPFFTLSICEGQMATLGYELNHRIYAVALVLNYYACLNVRSEDCRSAATTDE
jgi:hypothetical protein